MTDPRTLIHAAGEALLTELRRLRATGDRLPGVRPPSSRCRSRQRIGSAGATDVVTRWSAAESSAACRTCQSRSSWRWPTGVDIGTFEGRQRQRRPPPHGRLVRERTRIAGPPRPRRRWHPRRPPPSRTSASSWSTTTRPTPPRHRSRGAAAPARPCGDLDDGRVIIGEGTEDDGGSSPGRAAPASIARRRTTALGSSRAVSTSFASSTPSRSRAPTAVARTDGSRSESTATGGLDLTAVPRGRDLPPAESPLIHGWQRPLRPVTVGRYIPGPDRSAPQSQG